MVRFVFKVTTRGQYGYVHYSLVIVFFLFQFSSSRAGKPLGAAEAAAAFLPSRNFQHVPPAGRGKVAQNDFGRIVAPAPLNVSNSSGYSKCSDYLHSVFVLGLFISRITTRLMKSTKVEKIIEHQLCWTVSSAKLLVCVQLNLTPWLCPV